MNENSTIQSGTAHNGDVSLAYEVFGPATGTPVLLLMGLGMQMVIWADDFCHELVGRGFQVARMDNRDVGLSTHLDGPADGGDEESRPGCRSCGG